MGLRGRERPPPGCGARAGVLRRRAVRFVLAGFGAAACLTALLSGSAASARFSEPAPLLPDLVTLQPSDLRIVRVGRRLALQLSNTVANLGSSALELEGEVDPVTGRTRAYQRLFYDDGSSELVLAGEFIFDNHQTHNHWHLADFARYELREIGKHGAIGRALSTSDKLSFCLTDSLRIAPELPGSPPDRVYYCSQDTQGISVGWADVYGYFLEGQSLDLNRVKDGNYYLVSHADPEQRLADLNRDNNVTLVRIQISRQRRRVRILPSD